ncbi:alpha/beta hydrolase [Kitasatospora sp. NBC_01287]|uniref:RBBP9/YdeN family alpha/beta hydrolase n=1 Tax=Kitasatospora sp. NBC_01287 TaxID=2903573 RepID=UPI002252A5DB|nr:alpha/beta hydrolase [Kitasatospora sp. NBC_01287]MCX4745466.1 alpha/beta hydrolase [Kitasatospora sp. NBC_01287]
MTTDDLPTVLVLPGYQNSGPEHWQSHWERGDPRLVRVEQADWDRPLLTDWAAALDRAVREQSAERSREHSRERSGPVVLAAHSLGCVTVAHWAARAGAAARALVRGALLVAPADIDTVEIEELVNFRPIPLLPLPFPSTVVASSDDPYCTLDRARLLARGWGSRLVEAGPRGHLNAASGLGDWPEGRALLADLS